MPSHERSELGKIFSKKSMERICDFLCYNWTQLMCKKSDDSRKADAGRADCDVHITRPSYIIRLQYPERPNIYDGVDAQQVRRVRITDLTLSYVQHVLAEREQQQAELDVAKAPSEVIEEQTAGKACTSASKPNGISAEELNGLAKAISGGSWFSCENTNSQTSLIAGSAADDDGENCAGNSESDLQSNCSSDCVVLKPDELAQLELMTAKLYDIWICGHEMAGLPTPPKWQTLRPAERMNFYWAAVTRNTLLESPYENFKRLYALEHERRCGPTQAMHFDEQARSTWQQMQACERLPFCMESFIYCIAKGLVQLDNEQQVRCVFNKVRQTA